MCLISEFADGDLDRFMAGRAEAGRLSVRRGFGEWTAVARQICDGIDYMHSMGVTHNDLKPANIFFKFRGGAIHVLLADFGGSTFVDAKGAIREGLDHYAWTSMFVPPAHDALGIARRHTGKEDHFVVDLYSVAKTLCVLAVGDYYARERELSQLSGSPALTAAARIVLGGGAETRRLYEGMWPARSVLC